MTVELWIGQTFETPYERDALTQFMADMEAVYGPTDELCLVLANYNALGSQVDLTVLKQDAVIVIELKGTEEPFKAYENGLWLTIPNQKKIGTGDRNPFEQVKSYRLRWAELLRVNRDKFAALDQAEEIVFFNVNAVVAVSPALHPDTEDHLPRLIWFKLVGLDKLVDLVYKESSSRLRFSEAELRTLARDILRLKQTPIPKPQKPVLRKLKSAEVREQELRLEQRLQEVEVLLTKLHQWEKELLQHHRSSQISNNLYLAILGVIILGMLWLVLSR
ncbi:MAG: hypothetical protein HC875_27590 [Anaerolineales bacterium]|nr:hypothetical protein [Anaerolineales bacterium]